MDKNRTQYFYGDAGFSKFFRRSIDNPSTTVSTLSEYARTATGQVRNINFDQQQVTGNIGDVVTIGDISIDGTAPNITMSKDGVMRAVFGANPSA